ncbi:MAG: hypothetical protein ABWX94_03310 [Candidatus Saccharimonadales bacterium]
MSNVEQTRNTGSEGGFDSGRQGIPESIIQPDEIRAMLLQERRRGRRRAIIWTAAGVVTVATAAFVMRDAGSEVTPSPTIAAGNTDSGNTPQPQSQSSPNVVPQIPETGPMRGSLCKRMQIGEFLGWTGEKHPEAYRPDTAVCTSETTGLNGMALRAHGKWSWEHLQNGTSPLGYIEISVYDTAQPGGRSALSQLAEAYNPASSRTMELGGSTVTFASVDGRTIVHDTTNGIDTEITTRLAQGLDSPAAYPALEGAQVAALSRLVPVLAQG